MEYTYKYREDCWFKGKCPREKRIGCDSACVIQSEFAYLLNTSNLPKELMKTTPLQPDTRDLPAFYTLSDIQKDAENFVTDGRFLYLWSLNLGNGKTSFAAKIAKTYMAMKCIGNNYRDRVWFEYVPTFLLMSKDFANKDERQEHIKNSMKRELLILDDIGAVQNTSYDISTLSSLIDYRYSNGLATIFTSNISPEMLATNIGSRLADRVLSDVCLELVGASRRDHDNKYVSRRGKK